MMADKRLLPALLVGMMVLMIGFSPANAEDDPLENLNSWHYPYGQDGPDDWYYGWYVKSGVTYYGVDGDEGRFREDRFIDDDVTGGLEELRYSSENLEVSVRAIAEDLFGVEAHYIKPDVFRVDFEFEKHRKYYDGSNEAWDPTLYGFSGEFPAELDDDNLYADRVDLNLEGTLLLPDLPHIVLGWHHWERFGDEVLLRGERVRVTGDPVPRLRSAPAVSDLDGKSDTVYVEIPVTFDDKYNFKFRQEYEDYRDDQLIVFPRYIDADVEQFRTFEDEPEWREYRTLLSFDSFITEDFYMSANYYRSDLENEFTRDVVRPGSSDKIINTDVDNDRVTNVFTLGFAFLNIAKHGKLQTNFRAEHSDTDANSLGFEDDGVTPHAQSSDQQETRLGESVEFVWKGIPNTTVSLEGEWEQRFMDVEEVADVSDHEISTDFGGPELFIRDADIDYENQEYTVTVVNRPRRDLKLTARYRYKDYEQDYDENVDDEINLSGPAPVESFYPGILGDFEQNVHEITLKTDWHFLPAWTATGQYQYENDEIEYDIQDTEGQDMEVHRISATVFGAPMPKLMLTGMLMYENYDLDTPTDIPTGTDWEDGTGAYDYKYDSYVLFLSGNYVINEKWSANAAYQYTGNTGKDVENELNEIWLGVDYKLDESKTISARYEYFDFEDELGGGFDDYDGHGVYVSLAYRF